MTYLQALAEPASRASPLHEQWESLTTAVRLYLPSISPPAPAETYIVPRYRFFLSTVAILSLVYNHFDDLVKANGLSLFCFVRWRDMFPFPVQLKRN